MDEAAEDEVEEEPAKEELHTSAAGEQYNIKTRQVMLYNNERLCKIDPHHRTHHCRLAPQRHKKAAPQRSFAP